MPGFLMHIFKNILLFKLSTYIWISNFSTALQDIEHAFGVVGMERFFISLCIRCG